MSEHIVSPKIYLAVFGTLISMTLVTWFASTVDLSTGGVNFNPVVALAIAGFKAVMVILFFMHVKYEANWKYVLTIPAAMMSVFLMMMLVPDVGMRYRHSSQEQKQSLGSQALEREIQATARARAGD